MKKVMKGLFIIAAMVFAFASSYGQGTIVWNINNDPGNETPPPSSFWNIPEAAPVVDDNYSTDLTPPPITDQTLLNPPTISTSDESTAISFDASPDSLITAAPEPSPFAIIMLSVILLVSIPKFRQRFRFLSILS